MELPKPLGKLLWREFAEYREAKHMPFITTPERIGMKKGLLKGIELGLELKFGSDGLKLLPEIRELHDHEVLQAVLEAIKTAATPEDLRRVWKP
jgi:hypothetical protein